MLIDYQLADLFPDWADNGGIFSAMSASAPWAGVVSADTLDVAYFGLRSGDKPPSPLVMKLSDDGDPLTQAAREKLADIILDLNTPNFSRLWATLSAQYNPLNNYDMTESETEQHATAYGKTQQRTDNLLHGRSSSETRTPNLTTTDAGTESTTRTPNLTETRTPNTTITDSGTENATRTPNLTETRTPNTTETQTTGIYGFNSSSASNSDRTEKTETGTETKTTTGTDANAITKGNTRTETGTETKATTGTETNSGTSGNTRTETGTETRQTSGTDTDTGTVTTSDSGRDTTTVTRTLTRSGNIGVTTSQQMLQSERELWAWNFFNDVVFPAVDHVLTLPIYGSVCYCPTNTGWAPIEQRRHTVQVPPNTVLLFASTNDT
jgi:hypothetical protein